MTEEKNISIIGYHGTFSKNESEIWWQKRYRAFPNTKAISKNYKFAISRKTNLCFKKRMHKGYIIGL